MRLRLCFLLVVFSALFSGEAVGQEYVHQPSRIAPLYFGPSAFPVPDMPEVVSRPSAYLRADVFSGRIPDTENRDFTQALSFGLFLPLWTDRACFKVWGELYEFYQQTSGMCAFRSVPSRYPLTDFASLGPIYFSTDILLVREEGWRPEVLVRAAAKTASEDSLFNMRRCYDCPGYWFDVAASKTFGCLKLTLSAGFLCWQIKRDQQNDAFMYGIKLDYSKDCFNAGICFSGYSGWEQEGDRPMTIKLDAGYVAGLFKPFARFQYGFRDYPFTQFSLGLLWNFK